jgi:hypothetical protein
LADSACFFCLTGLLTLGAAAVGFADAFFLAAGFGFAFAPAACFALAAGLALAWRLSWLLT